MYAIETERLVLRIITMNDLELVFETLNFRNTAETISIFSWPMTMEQAESWCQRSETKFREKNDFLFIAIDKVSQNPVGCTGCHKEADEAAEVGYWVAEPFQKKGYASEMLKAMIEFVRHETDYTRLFATVKPGNAGSSRTLEKNGFTLKDRKNIKSLDGKLYLKDVYELEKV